jgi:uncharacterized protein (DUF302 family)
MVDKLTYDERWTLAFANILFQKAIPTPDDLSTMKESPIDGLTTIASSFSPKETMDRLEAEIRAKGMSVFARVDHAAGAAEAGLELRPTELIIFGNARGGTPLMQASQTAGIDLPLKVLVWQDAAGKTWLSYNEPSWIVQRHGLGVRAEIIDKMAAALSAMSRTAANTR